MPAAKPALHTHGVWSRLTALARQHRLAYVAVPYFGSGASKLLPLKAGSRLVLKFDREAIQGGQVNPKEVISLIRRGVKVHACANLHAKVFVFGNTAIVGSANVSASSTNSLIEACVEINAHRFAATCRKFVDSLAGDRVGLEFAKTMVPLYKPPQSGRAPRTKGKPSRRVVPRHSDLWLVSLVSGDWKDIDRAQEEAGWPSAERALINPKESKIETFLWYGLRLLQKLKPGQRVLMNTKIDKHKVFVSPPGRVLSIRRYRVKNRKKAIVYVELPKNKRSREITSFIKSLGPIAQALGKPHRTKRLHNPELIYTLGKVFA